MNAPHLLRILHGRMKGILEGGWALATIHQSWGCGGQHLPHREVVQVHVEVSRNLPVVFYVKQGQGDKERLDLNSNINKTSQS